MKDCQHQPRNQVVQISIIRRLKGDSDSIAEYHLEIEACPCCARRLYSDAYWHVSREEDHK